MKIGIIVGTRPEIIKMAPIIRECANRGLPFFIMHSNQHYSVEMDKIFFEELELQAPNYNLDVGSGEHSNQTGNILIKMEPILMREKPDIVLVQGDTNTVLAGALAASKLNIKVGHVEAGLRSYDRTMPEETNRVLTDHMSDFLFAVGPNQYNILTKEGISKEKIHVVGNTVSDSLFQHLDISNARQNTVLQKLGIANKKYFLVTAHRASNVDIESHLIELLKLFDEIYKEFKLPLIWPIHPRTQAKITSFNLQVPSYLVLHPPVGYLDFIQLQQQALLILTDSGGIQEEACLLGVPCITLRDNTERPESVEVGANVLVGRNANKALQAANKWLSNEIPAWDNPFGDGHVAERILDIILGINTKADAPELKNESIAVIGMGYMGLPIASLLANAGYKVAGVDVNSSKVALINQAKCPFDEVGLPKLLKSVIQNGNLVALEKPPSSDVYLIAVPTPHANNKCDLSYVLSAVNSIIEVAKNGQTVIIESTISPGTSLLVKEIFAEKNLAIEVVHCPERAIPGHTLDELVNNDRIIGASSTTAHEKVSNIYKSFVKGEVFLTDVTTAECVKLVENTSRDVGIAFANELSEVCNELGTDVYQVIKLANRHPRVNILNPGPGVGGHCIPIDPWFLVEKTQSGKLIRLARNINDQRPLDIAQKVIKKAAEKGFNKIGILGVAYKPNVDDCRETPAEPIVEVLNQNGLDLKYHDPFVSEWNVPREIDLQELMSWADILVLVTAHDIYKNLVSEIEVMDTCGLLNKD